MKDRACAVNLPLTTYAERTEASRVDCDTAALKQARNILLRDQTNIQTSTFFVLLFITFHFHLENARVLHTSGNRITNIPRASKQVRKYIVDSATVRLRFLT